MIFSNDYKHLQETLSKKMYSRQYLNPQYISVAKDVGPCIVPCYMQVLHFIDTTHVYLSGRDNYRIFHHILTTRMSVYCTLVPCYMFCTLKILHMCILIRERVIMGNILTFQSQGCWHLHCTMLYVLYFIDTTYVYSCKGEPVIIFLINAKEFGHTICPAL